MAVVIGAQVWSLSSFRGFSNTATVESTVVSDFSVILHNCRFSGGNASTVTNGGMNLIFVDVSAIKANSRCWQLATGIVVVRQQCEKFSA